MTLFKSHISHKLDNSLKIFTYCDILRGCGLNGIKIDDQILKWESFSDKKKNRHTGKVYGVLLEVLYGIIVDNNAHSTIDN